MRKCSFYKIVHGISIDSNQSFSQSGFSSWRNLLHKHLLRSPSKMYILAQDVSSGVWGSTSLRTRSSYSRSGDNEPIYLCVSYMPATLASYLPQGFYYLHMTSNWNGIYLDSYLFKFHQHLSIHLSIHSSIYPVSFVHECTSGSFCLKHISPSPTEF